MVEGCFPPSFCPASEAFAALAPGFASCAVGASGFGATDAFYEARGCYHPFFTCNTWCNLALKRAGLPCCVWTPFASPILHAVGVEGESHAESAECEPHAESAENAEPESHAEGAEEKP